MQDCIQMFTCHLNRGPGFVPFHERGTVVHKYMLLQVLRTFSFTTSSGYCIWLHLIQTNSESFTEVNLCFSSLSHCKSLAEDYPEHFWHKK
jgi:hypothetical protein